MKKEIRKCAFCGEIIEPNYLNACEDCIQFADEEPEAFMDLVLTV